MYHQFSYVIPYRKNSESCERGLNFLINYLNRSFPTLDIIIVEQDTEPQPNNLSGDFKLLFTYNPGLFNKGWGMNCGVLASDRPYIVCGDSNTFLTIEDFQSFFNAAFNEGTDVVIPCGITEKHSDFKCIKSVQLFSSESIGYIKELGEVDKKTLTIPLILFNKERLLKAGGWFEEFEGGEEINFAMDELLKDELSIKELNLQLYQIGGSCIDTETISQLKEDENRRILEKIKHSFINKGSYNRDRKKISSILGLGNSDRYNRESCEFKINEIRQLLKRTSNNKSNDKTGQCLVLAITTYNRIEYLHSMLVSFLTTRNNNFNWKVIIADDGSRDDTKKYLDELCNFWKELDCIYNNRRGVSHQFNTIVNRLKEFNYRVCFTCDDDILFLQNGWEELYLNTIDQTGYDHLCYYYTGWLSYLNLKSPERKGDRLVAFCEPINVQGAFFTITPALIEAVGYMDAANFSPRGWGHTDFTIRCSKAGFNDSKYIYDVEGSNDFIVLNYNENYKSTVEIGEMFAKLCPPEETERRMRLIKDSNRVYIDYNESPIVYDDSHLLKLSYSIIDDLKKEIVSLRQTKLDSQIILADELDILKKTGIEKDIILNKQELELKEQNDLIQQLQEAEQGYHQQMAQLADELDILKKTGIEKDIILNKQELELKEQNDLIQQLQEAEQGYHQQMAQLADELDILKKTGIEQQALIDKLVNDIYYYQEKVSHFQKIYESKSIWNLIKHKLITQS